MSDRIPERDSYSAPRSTAAVEDAAAAWLARRDRGLSEAERVEFSRWVADQENARVLDQLEGPFGALDRAARLRPAKGAALDPDLLLKSAPASSGYGRKRAQVLPRRRVFWLATSGALAAAGIFVFSLLLDQPRPSAETAPRRMIVRHSPERLPLPDGSTVELNRGTRVETSFTSHERRIRLSAGEAHFDVTKDPARPFIVMVGNVEVRAVGTAFIVSASSAAVEVVVTEGRVRVDDSAGQNLIAPTMPPVVATQLETSSPAAANPPALDAGQRLVVPRRASSPQPVAASVATADEMERALAWRRVWLEFGDLPLNDVVREFNRHATGPNSPVLAVADDPTGRVLVSGTFRADGVEAFVRLLESSFGITATRDPTGHISLRKLK